jgi:hypothetical protein
MKRVLAPAVLLSCAAVAGSSQERTAPPRWYKGVLHAHTLQSDGDAPPAVVAAWYKQHGFHFAAITDHNMLTDPAAYDTDAEDEFLLIGGEEITNPMVVHVNAIGIREAIPPRTGSSVTELLQASIDAVRAQGGVPLINHPNFAWAFTAKEMRPLKGIGLLEIASGHPLVNNAGDGRTPSTEAMWDELLTAGLRVHAAAVDDSHTFTEEFTIDRASPGRAWVVVRAAALTRDAIVGALDRGEFYASTGVALRSLESDDRSMSVTVDARPSADGKLYKRHHVTFVGSGGRVLATVYENPARYEFTGGEGYVRARVEDSGGWRAWTQAVRVPSR